MSWSARWDRERHPSFCPMALETLSRRCSRARVRIGYLAARRRKPSEPYPPSWKMRCPQPCWWLQAQSHSQTPPTRQEAQRKRRLLRNALPIAATSPCLEPWRLEQPGMWCGIFSCALLPLP